MAALEALPQRPAGLVLASPANPTGPVLPPEELAAIAAWCDRSGVRLVSDEIYHGITFGAATSSAWHTSRHAIVVNSFSKYFAMTGWRIGWLLVPDDLVDAVDRLAGNFALCPPTLSQLAAVQCFGAYDELLEIVVVGVNGPLHERAGRVLDGPRGHVHGRKRDPRGHQWRVDHRVVRVLMPWHVSASGVLLQQRVLVQPERAYFDERPGIRSEKPVKAEVSQAGNDPEEVGDLQYMRATGVHVARVVIAQAAGPRVHFRDDLPSKLFDERGLQQPSRE